MSLAEHLPGRRPQGRGRAERVTLIVSIVVLVALIGGLGTLHLTRGERPPSFRVEADVAGAKQVDGQWHLPVSIENTGDETTDQLIVVVEQTLDGEPPLEAELEFQFIAGGETVDGVAVLDERPTKDAISASARSFTLP